MALSDFTIVRRSLTARWFATATTVLTVGVAVGLLLTLIAMRSAGERAFARGTGNIHLLVSTDSSPLNSVLNSIYYAGKPARAERLSRFGPLVSDPRVAWAIPVVQGDSYRGFPTLATTPEFFTLFEPAKGEKWTFASGGPFARPLDAVLGAEAAASTGLKVGDRIHLTHGAPTEHGEEHEHEGFAFTVTGTLDPTATAHDRAVFITTEAAWLIHAHDKREDAAKKSGAAMEEPTVANLTDGEKIVTGLYVRVRGRGDTDTPPALPELYEQLRKDGTLTVAQPGQQVGGLFRIVSGVDRIIFALAIAVLVSGAITIMLVLYQAMELRRRQVAVLRVLGASRGRVFMLALTEAAVIGLLASALGSLLALVGTRAVSAALHAGVGLRIQPDLDARTLVAVTAGATALACLAGVIPAAAAYRTDVLRNLRPIG